MVATKWKGVFAAPGEYTYGDAKYMKTAEELKLAAERQPIIRLVMGHPVDGHPFARDVIGTVSQKWDEKNQVVNGDFWFYDDMIPDDIREKLYKKQPIPISAGIMPDEIVDDTLKGISYTHMAIVTDEDPKCPLDVCGINVIMESEPNRIVLQEQKTELEAPIEKEAEPVVEEVTKPDEVEVTEPESEEPETTEPAEQKPEEEVEPEPVEEVKLVPEVIIPVGTIVPKEWERDESGWVTFEPRRRK